MELLITTGAGRMDLNRAFTQYTAGTTDVAGLGGAVAQRAEDSFGGRPEWCGHRVAGREQAPAKCRQRGESIIGPNAEQAQGNVPPGERADRPSGEFRDTTDVEFHGWQRTTMTGRPCGGPVSRARFPRPSGGWPDQPRPGQSSSRWPR